MTRVVRHLLASMILLALILLALPLGAQQSADSTRDSGAGRPSLADSVLATATGGGWLRVERGFAIGVLDAQRDALDEAPSLPRALQGRMPGVSVTQGEGFLGASSRVWLRGPSSALVNEPLLIVDGARTHAAEGIRPFGLDAGPSRLEDLDPEMIDRVEVLRGAAASAIYGPGASKGVILVTTKRGHEGPTRWTAFAESGPLLEVTAFPANHGTLGISTSTGAPVTNCPLSSQAAGSCTPITRRSWNPLESASPFRTGWSNAAGLNVAGGTEQYAYRAAANHERATGVYRRDDGRTTNASINLGMHATPRISVGLSGSYRTEDLRHPTPDYLMLGLGGESADDPVRRGYGSATFGGAEEVGRRDEAGRRVTAAFNAGWAARDWLHVRAVVGYDRLRSGHGFRVRRGQFTFPGDPPSADSATFQERRLDLPESRTAGVEAEGRYRYLGIAARTALGFEYLRDDDRADQRSALIPDAGGMPAFESETHITSRRISKGVRARQHLAWRRVFVNASLRADNLGDSPVEMALAPSIDVSWLIKQGDTSRGAILGDLRLRAAYGRGGAHLIPSAEVSTSFGLRPSEETAERMEELEVGADLSMFSDRLLAQITAYRATNDQGLITRVAPAGSGMPLSYVSNDGEFRTTGLEVAIDGRLLASERLTWDVGVRAALHDSETSISGFAPLFLGEGGQRIEHGTSIGEYFPGTYTYADVNGDNLIAASELTFPAEDPASAGSPFPAYEAGFESRLTIGRSIRITTLVDRRAGQKLYNGTGRARCSVRANCVEQHDPSTPLAAQAATVAAQNGRVAGWIEDASYTKLREVALSIAVPRQWTGSASSARLSLTGRNLYTWTGYSGLDPEVITRDRNGIIATGGFYQPPLRTFTARLDLSW